MSETEAPINNIGLDNNNKIIDTALNESKSK